jgi:hypothetical protein
MCIVSASIGRIEMGQLRDIGQQPQHNPDPNDHAIIMPQPPIASNGLQDA